MWWIAVTSVKQQATCYVPVCAFGARVFHRLLLVSMDLNYLTGCHAAAATLTACMHGPSHDKHDAYTASIALQQTHHFIFT